MITAVMGENNLIFRSYIVQSFVFNKPISPNLNEINSNDYTDIFFHEQPMAHFTKKCVQVNHT